MQVDAVFEANQDLYLWALAPTAVAMGVALPFATGAAMGLSAAGLASTTAWGAVSGAAIGAGISIGTDIYYDRDINWSRAGREAIYGGISGAVFAAPGAMAFQGAARGFSALGSGLSWAGSGLSSQQSFSLCK